MNRIALDLGFIKIYWYSLFIFTAMSVATFLVFKEAKKKKLNMEKLTDLIFYTVILGIIGARTYYVVFNFNYYLSNPIEILQIWNGGLAIHGGLIGAMLFIYYYCRKHKIKIFDILDITVVGLIIAQAIGRWGNFFNGEAFGRITTYDNLVRLHIPKFIIAGMNIDGAYREPTFLYESILCIVGFVIMIVIRKKYSNLKKGQLTGFYLTWYGVVRFIIESLRSDSLMLGPIKIAQLVSIIFVIVGIYLLLRYRNKTEEKYLYNYID